MSLALITYYKHACPQCGTGYGYSLRRHKLWPGPRSKICRKCKQPLSTGVKEWPEFSVEEKIKFLLDPYIWLVFGSVFAGLVFIGLVQDGYDLRKEWGLIVDLLRICGWFLFSIYIFKGIQLCRSILRCRAK